MKTGVRQLLPVITPSGYTILYNTSYRTETCLSTSQRADFLLFDE
jgi:hypothetical protein